MCNMRPIQLGIIFVTTAALFMPVCTGYQLKNKCEIEDYINSLINAFGKDTRDEKFVAIITPPERTSVKSQSDFLMPKVFLWSPQEQFAECHLKCPLHHTPLRPWKWISNLSGEDVYWRKPRIVFDLFGNILLVQRYYLCVHNRKTHRITSASPDLMATMPTTIKSRFPLSLFKRSGCSKKLVHYVKRAIDEGMNFLKISENIAALNHEEHARQGAVYNAARADGLIKGETYNFEDFFDNDIFSFPSNDQLIRIFLNEFASNKDRYIHNMMRTRATSLSCDHTFKISKNIGVVSDGEEKKFLDQYDNMFIVLNELGEVLDWRFTTSTAFEQVDDLLTNLRDRIIEGGGHIKMICIDDCCKNRQKYVDVFSSSTDVKLDLYHACQRVVQTLSANNPQRNQYAKEFGLIFRQQDDIGVHRTKPTPNEVEIEENLDTFVKKWNNVPSSGANEETSKQIENLRLHIRKGCLSCIPPGYGTEKNERLHRILNSSLVSGATRITIELAVALLMCLFYKHSKKASTNLLHKCSSRVQCIPPIETVEYGNKDTTSDWLPFKRQGTSNNSDNSGSTENEQLSSIGESITIGEEIEDVCAKSVAESVLSSAFSIDHIISNVSTTNANRAFDPIDILYLADLQVALTFEEMYDTNGNDPMIKEHETRLARHLAGFKLTTAPVQMDGNCAFRSITRMLQVTYKSEDEAVLNHLTTLGLLKSEESDMDKLRQLFADEIVEREQEYTCFLSSQDQRGLLDEIDAFRRDGVFDRALGDLVIKACANLLKLPIMVITSNETCPYAPFVPNETLTDKPIYIAFHYYGAGHYDATQTLESGATSATMERDDNVSGCSCGSKISTRTKFACQSTKEGKSKCPCVKKGKLCSSLCKCRHCANAPEKSRKAYSCRCGEGRISNNETFASCTDVKGKRKTICPCFSNSLGCVDCKCYNCDNEFGRAKQKQSKCKSSKRKQTLSSPQSLKRRRGTQFMKDSGLTDMRGGWTQLETCILHMAESFIYSTPIPPTNENVHHLYNYVVKSSECQLRKLGVSAKTQKQTSGKLAFVQRKRQALYRRNFGVESLELGK